MKQAKRGSAKAKQPQAVVLAAQGLSQREIAVQLGMSPATVNRALKGQEENVEVIAQSLTQKLASAIESHVNLEDRAVIYANLARSAKNEAVQLGTLQRIDDLAGVVTERERMRINRATEAPNTQPLFAFNGNVSVNVTLSQDASNKKET